jgi:hypothetical protein
MEAVKKTRQLIRYYHCNSSLFKELLFINYLKTPVSKPKAGYLFRYTTSMNSPNFNTGVKNNYTTSTPS